MIVLYRGFSQEHATLNNHVLTKERKRVFRESLRELRQRQQQRRESIGIEDGASFSAPNPHSRAPLRTTQRSRRLLLPTNQLLNTQDIQHVNQIYHAEEEALNKAQQGTVLELLSERGEDLHSPVLTGEELMEQYAVIEKKMRSTTDLVTKFNNLTTTSGAAEREYGFPHEGELILEDFFRICQLPNDAEVLMLSTVCEIDPVNVAGWFQDKRRAKLRFLYAIENALNKGGMNKVFRKQRETVVGGPRNT